MQKERTTLKVAALLNNEGQLGWLPTNPRQWTKSDIDLTAQSLTNDPDFLEDRPLLVVPGPTAKSFIVFAGNLRLTAARQLKIKEVPGIIYTPENETDQLTIKRRSVLDNGAFGAWDFDALANEWDDLPLGDWGVPAWNPADDLEPIDDKDKDKGNTLGEQYSQNVGEVLYEPKETHHKVADLYANNGVKFDKMINALKDEELKKMLRLRAAWFTDFNFAKVADYYAYQATPEEQRVFEALGLVLLDRDQLISNGFADIVKDFEDEGNH